MFNRLILIGYTGMTALVLGIVLCGKGGQLPALLWGVAGLGIWTLLCARWTHGRDNIVRERDVMPERRGKRAAALLGWAALLAAQLFMSFHAYFLTGWDVRTIMESAYAIAGGDALIDHYYFSLYPNNALMTLFFAGIIRIVRLLLGNPGLDRCVFVLIAVQCVINTVTGYLTLRAARKLTHSRAISGAVLGLYVIYLGLSPRVMIPYSDSLGVLFPVLMVNLYLGMRKEEHPWRYWLLLCLLAPIIYLIKPQPAIMMIAIAMVEAVRLLGQRRVKLCLARMGMLALITMLIAGPVFNGLVDLSPIQMNRERNNGMLHFVMMGLNEETIGQYSEKDVIFSVSALTRAERSQAQMGVIKERLAQMGIGGLAEHIRRKTVETFGNGMFNWGADLANFVDIADKDEVFSPLFKSLTRPGGVLYPYLEFMSQAIWLALLTAGLGCAAAYRRIRESAERDALCAMMLSLVGLIFFEWIFETGARYLFTFAPIYLLLGVFGMAYLIRCAGELCDGAKRHIRQAAGR